MRNEEHMKIIEVKNIKIGEGKPKICVPIVGITEDEILNAAWKAAQSSADLVEWRVDYFADVQNIYQVMETLQEMRMILLEKPLLFTFRTLKEGGERELDISQYQELNLAAVKTSLIDLIDVEIFMGDKAVKELVEKAHEYGVKVVGSNHEFHKTPEVNEMVRRLCKMQELGVDIPKIAVMPQQKKDVLNLLEATITMTEKYTDRPIITMAMAGLGAISRMIGEFSGSSITFASAGQISAPGQMTIGEVNEAMEILHKSLSQSK
jgi:3-dehydroquinate dehydratase-1